MKNNSKNKFRNIPKQNSNKKRKKIPKILIILLIIICLFVAYSTYKNGWGMQGILATMMGHNQTTKKELGEIKVLLLGVSTDISSKLTDTIIVASYNPDTQKANLLSIPRDTYVGQNEKKATSYDKINASYKKGPEKVLEEVNQITGLDIQYYIVIETEALVELVDAIGGVTFDVPIDMDYDDPTQDLHIHLKAGEQKLTGKQAEWVVRFRHNNDGTTYSSEYGNNDMGRMRTQRNFITTVAKQTIQLKNIFKIGEIVDVAYKNIETNLDINSIKDYIPYAIEFNTDNIITATLPGVTKKINSLWFFEVDKIKTKSTINDLFSLDQIEDDQAIQNSNSEIIIEVLNGSGVSKKLTQVTNLLKENGYKVYKTGTASTTTVKTSIINKSGKSDKISNDLKTLLGVGVVSEASNSTKNVDFTIIIGKDYK